MHNAPVHYHEFISIYSYCGQCNGTHTKFLYIINNTYFLIRLLVMVYVCMPFLAKVHSFYSWYMLSEDVKIHSVLYK